MPFPPAFLIGWRHSRVRTRRSHAAAVVLALLFIPLARAAGTSAAPEPVQTGPADAATPARMRLISQEQYFNSLGYVFGPDITVGAHFAPFRRTDGLLASGSSSAGVTIAQMQEFQRTANSLAEQIVSPANRAYLVRCTPRHDTGADRDCARDFLLPVGRLLFRRPLDKALADQVVARSVEGANELHDFYGGLAVALEGLLMAPQALFVADRAKPDPARPGYARLDAFSLASRLSFFLWNAAPDDELLRAAEKGELDSRERPREDGRPDAGEPAARDGRARVLRRHAALRRSRGAGQGSRHLPDLRRRDHRGRARADAAHAGRPAARQEARLPRPVHEPRHVHLAVARRHLRRGGAAGLDRLHEPARQPARGAADPGQFPGRACAPGPQFAHLARQGGARVAAVPDGAAPAAQRGLLAARGCELAHEDRARAPRRAPRKPGVRGMSQADRPDRAGFRELRRCGRVPCHRARRGHRCQRRARRQELRGPRRIVAGRARSPPAQRLPGQARLRLGNRRGRRNRPTSRCWIGWASGSRPTDTGCRTCCARWR